MLRVTIAADAAVAAGLAAELGFAGMHVTGRLEIAALEAVVFACLGEDVDRCLGCAPRGLAHQRRV